MVLRRISVRVGIFLAGLVVADQVALLTLLSDDRFLGRRVMPFDPPIFYSDQEESLGRIDVAVKRGGSLDFDALLGWCPRPGTRSGQATYDWAGCRIGTRPLAREKDQAVRRILAIGGSVTHGDEVEGFETWCALIDEAREDLEVANLGNSAYGIDQAVLRLRRDGPALEGDEVWLGFLPAAALRVTSLYRPALRHWSHTLAFKPRFRLDRNGNLELVANPARDLAHIAAMMRSQELFLEAIGDGDPWITRARHAYLPRGSHWTHRSFLTRVATTWWEHTGREYVSPLEDPESELYRLLGAIVLATAEEAAHQGAEFRLLILPGRDELAHLARHGRGFWETWAESIASQGVEVVDLVPAALGAGVLERDLFLAHGHLSPEGNRILADVLLEHLGM